MARRTSTEAGFTLIELMVVIVIIGILAALAVPSTHIATFDRHAYNDAGAVMQLFRSARARAVARGGAVVVAMSSNGATDRGTFSMWEAVQGTGGGGVAGGGFSATPIGSCKTPTSWAPLDSTNPSVLFIDGVNLNGAAGTAEADGDIETTINVYQGAAPTTYSDSKTRYICFTPLGRSYLNMSPGTTPPGWFDNLLPNTYPLEIAVQRAAAAGTGGTVRSVLVPPNGMARLFSHVL